MMNPLKQKIPLLGGWVRPHKSWCRLDYRDPATRLEYKTLSGFIVARS